MASRTSSNACCVRACGEGVAPAKGSRSDGGVIKAMPIGRAVCPEASERFHQAGPTRLAVLEFLGGREPNRAVMKTTRAFPKNMSLPIRPSVNRDSVRLSVLRYSSSYLVDLRAGLLIDFEATPAFCAEEEWLRSAKG